MKRSVAFLLMASMFIGSTDVRGEELIPKQTFNTYLDLCEELNQEIEIVVKRPIYDIPLSKDLQNYIWQLSQKYDMSYELILGLIKTESNFDPKIVSYNGTSVGLFQINKNTYKWLAKETGISNPNLRNPYHSSKMGVYYLNYLRETWMNKGYSKERSIQYALLSYNKGQAGAKRHIKLFGSRSKYTTKIYENKNKIIKGDVNE